MRTRTRWQYSVVSQREGNRPKRKTVGSLKRAHDLVGVMTSPEPWRFFGTESERERQATDYVCCAGTRYDECSCGGRTLAQDTEDARKNLPRLEWVRIEMRSVTTTYWAELESAAPRSLSQP